MLIIMIIIFEWPVAIKVIIVLNVMDQVDKIFRKEIEAEDLNNKQTSAPINESPRKIVRTFGSSVNELSLEHCGSPGNDGTDKSVAGENTTRFTREMKMLGHDHVTSPNSIKRK